MREVALAGQGLSRNIAAACADAGACLPGRGTVRHYSFSLRLHSFSFGSPLWAPLPHDAAWLCTYARFTGPPRGISGCSAGVYLRQSAGIDTGSELAGNDSSWVAAGFAYILSGLRRVSCISGTHLSGKRAGASDRSGRPCGNAAEDSGKDL